MGLGEVKTFERGADPAAAEVVVDEGGGELVRADHVEPAGDDSQPLPGDKAVTVDAPGAGGQQAVAYYDAKNAGKAGPGEKRIYARDAGGNVVASWWLKSDGSVELENAGGIWKFSPDGKTECPGDAHVEGGLTVKGELKVDLEISAMNGTVPVKLSTHIHNTPFGPTSPPTPGT